MRIFVTGATGFVGRSVSRELLAAGHSVTGLARSDEAVAALSKAAVTPLRGELADLDSLKRGASEADAVIHLGFIHDFANYGGAAEVDRLAIETIGAALAGSGRPFIATSGTAMLSGKTLVTEDDAQPAPPAGAPARVSELVALAFAEQGVAAQAMRLPPTVHGDGDHGFVAALIGIARDKGASAYVGDGANHWPAVHVSDAARAYMLALEHGAAGQRHHAVGEQGIAFREIAEAIGARLGLPVVSVAPDAAAEHFGWMGRFAQIDVPASSALTRERLGWTPTGRTLMEDLELADYFG